MKLFLFWIAPSLQKKLHTDETVFFPLSVTEITTENNKTAFLRWNSRICAIKAAGTSCDKPQKLTNVFLTFWSVSSIIINWAIFSLFVFTRLIFFGRLEDRRQIVILRQFRQKNRDYILRVGPPSGELQHGGAEFVCNDSTGNWTMEYFWVNF